MDKTLFEEYKKDLLKLKERSLKLKEIAAKEGIYFNDITGEFKSVPEYIPVISMYARGQSYDESAGYYDCFAKISKIPDELLELFKETCFFTDKQKWEDLFQKDEIKKIDGMKKFLTIFDYSLDGCLTADTIGYIYDTKEAREYEFHHYNEGIKEVLGGIEFGQECDGQCILDGYVDIFYLDENIYEKLKEENYFEHSKYIKPN